MAENIADQALLKATIDLAKEVEGLEGRLTAKELLYKRTQRLTRLSLILVAVAVLGLVVALVAVVRINNVATQNMVNAKIACENANDQRAANLRLWTLVVQTSSQDPRRERTPADVQRTQAFQGYIEKLYAPRDCNDLDRRYKIPDPPVFEF